MVPVDLVVNSYERTYRDVLRAGFFESIQRQNRVRFRGRYAVINNVSDRGDAERRAVELRGSGAIDGYAFVSDHIDDAMRRTGTSRRSLGERPYFIDYGLVMTQVGNEPFLLGWDAEVELEEEADWISPALELLGRRSDVFSVAPRWPARHFDTLDEETITSEPPWRFTWSFSDQLWLVRREEAAGHIYRHLAPASLARHDHHSFSFEARIESYQRVSRRYRAVHESIRYTHRDLSPVLGRLGGASRKERARAVAARVVRKGLRILRSSRPTLRLP